MTDKLFFVNLRSGRRFQVLKLDKETGTITMRGEHAEFTETFDKERFKALGYELMRESELAQDNTPPEKADA